MQVENCRELLCRYSLQVPFPVLQASGSATLYLHEYRR
jgi:hypothetical protein